MILITILAQISGSPGRGSRLPFSVQRGLAEGLSQAVAPPGPRSHSKGWTWSRWGAHDSPGGAAEGGLPRVRGSTISSDPGGYLASRVSSLANQMNKSTYLGGGGEDRGPSREGPDTLWRLPRSLQLS